MTHRRDEKAGRPPRALDSFSDEVIATASRWDRLQKWTGRVDFGPVVVEGAEEILAVSLGSVAESRKEPIAECAAMLRRSKIALHPEFPRIVQYWTEKEEKLAASKYAFTGETREHFLHIGLTSRDTRSVILHQIHALRDIPRHGVRAGDLGGWIESEDNLSQDGGAWIDRRVKVWGEARVTGDAALSGYIELSGPVAIGSGVADSRPELDEAFDAGVETARLERFLFDHRVSVVALADAAEENDVYEDDLDELAHDAGGGLLDRFSSESGAVSQWISDGMNNRGLDFQIAFILQENGIGEGEKLLKAHFAEVSKSATAAASPAPKFGAAGSKIGEFG